MNPIENAVHLCVDMQLIFANGAIWETVDGEGASNEVLSTMLDAVNIGFLVLIVEDALRTSSDAGPRRADDDVPPAFR
jgi:hypothetical protein